MAKEKAETPKTDMKYGIAELAEAVGMVPETVRLKLRKLGVPKAGKSYGWNTKDELKAVVEKLKAEPTKVKVEKKAEAKPAKAEPKKAVKAEAKPAKATKKAA
jgi:hypothetical protein